MPMPSTVTRRRILQGLSALPLSWPLARAVAAEEPTRRLVLLMQNNGTQQSSFWPDARLSSPISSPILDALFLDPKTRADNGLRAKTNIVKGVYMPGDANGTSGNQHDVGFARLFTGEKLVSRAGAPWGGGISIDQVVAQHLGVEALTLAVLASQLEPHPKPGFEHRESFSYLGPATIKHPRTDPLEVYGALFPAAAGGPDPSARLALRKSVLDAVAGNITEIAQRLGPTERAKLDYHLSAVRDVERKLAARAPAPAGCTPPARPADYRALDPNAEVNQDTYIPQLVDDMIDLLVVALRCGMTRVATLQLGYGGGKWRFAWEGIDMDCHDEVAHRDTSDKGSTPENTRRVVLMNQYYASCVAKLATALDAAPEGSGTMLDNSLVVWGNELGRGDHSLENIPIVMLGRAGGALPRGGRLIDGGRQIFNRLGCTISNLMGKPAAGFGDAPSCGNFAGLL